MERRVIVRKPRALLVRLALGSIAGAGLLGLASVPGAAQTKDGTFSSPVRFMPRDGEVLYRSSCQACHMADAQGAAGAGVYPALARNPKLRTAKYPVFLVVNGTRAMPPFGDQMDDEQVAAVVNYLRSHFGNDYKDTVSAADVKAARH